MRRTLAPVLFASLLLSGCALPKRSPYVTPTVPMPDRFEHTGQRADPTRDMAGLTDTWWRSFDDPALDALIDLAIARNPDLAVATLRVRRAQLQARLAENASLPIPSGSVSSGISRSLSGARTQAEETSSGTVELTWEVDLFGRLNTQQDAARFEALATKEDRAAARLALIETAASLHWQIASVNERIALSDQSLADARQTEGLVAAQYRAGAVSLLELREAQQSVTAQEAALSQLRQARTEVREAMMVLLDGGAAPNGERQALDRSPLPDVAPGLPASLLGRRPDLRAAELRLRATLADADGVRASYYPALTLTGAAGTASSGLLNLLANPIGTLSAGLSLPFLNARAMRFDTAIARTRYEEAAIQFGKTLHTALAEVENALSAQAELTRQGEALLRARDAAAEVERLYEVRYRAGAIPFRAWLDAQERRRQAELAISANVLARFQNRMKLYQALGGGLGA